MASAICSSEQEAWEYLKFDQDSAADCPDYLYRGQAGRHFRHWPPLAQESLARHKYELDSIVPGDYRGFEDAIASETAPSIATYSDEAASLRSILTWGAITEHGQSLADTDPKAVLNWLNDQTKKPHRFDAVGSIGQHYGLMTGYTDASSSLAVAFWMATRDFATGAYLPSGQSVVYRWKLKELRASLKSINRKFGWTKSKETRVVDIRGIPHQIGKRPHNQCGWSLINFELGTVLLELIRMTDVIEAVVFLRTGPSPANNLALDFIAPPNENVALIFREITRGQLFSLVRQRVLDEWRQETPGILPHVNLCDPQYRNWVTR